MRGTLVQAVIALPELKNVTVPVGASGPVWLGVTVAEKVVSA